MLKCEHAKERSVFRTGFAWLLGDELWALGMFWLISVFAYLGPWAMLYQHDHLSLPEQYDLWQTPFLALGGWGLSSWGKSWGYCVPPWTPRTGWASLVGSTLHVLSRVLDGRMKDGSVRLYWTPGSLHLVPPGLYPMCLSPSSILICVLLLYTVEYNSFWILWVLLANHWAWQWSWEPLTHVPRYGFLHPYLSRCLLSFFNQ